MQMSSNKQQNTNLTSYIYKENSNDAPHKKQNMYINNL